jgi:hypothetical protein
MRIDRDFYAYCAVTTKLDIRSRGVGHRSRLTAECNILERFVLRQCGAVAACESRLLRAAANGSLRGDVPLGSRTLY